MNISESLQQIMSGIVKTPYNMKDKLLTTATIDPYILKKYFIGNLTANTVDFNKSMFPYLDPQHKSYDDFRRVFETSLAYMLIKYNLRRIDTEKYSTALVDIETKIEEILNKLEIYLRKHNKIDETLVDIISLYYLLNDSSRYLLNDKNKISLFKKIIKKIEKNFVKKRHSFFKRYHPSSRYHEYSGVLIDIITDHGISKDKEILLRTAKVLMKSQIVAFMIKLTKQIPDGMSEKIFYISAKIQDIYHLSSLFRNKAPSKEKSPNFLRTRGILKITENDTTKKVFSDSHFQEFNSLRRSTASKKAGPEYGNSEWSRLAKEQNQIYITGISGLGLISQGILEMIDIPIEKKYDFFELASPLIVFYFTGHSFFEFHQGSELFNKEYKQSLNCGFKEWEEYINSISNSLFIKSFNLAYFNNKRISACNFNISSYKEENRNYFFLKKSIYLSIDNKLLTKLVSNRSGRKAKAIRTYRDFILNLISKGRYISSHQLAVQLINLIRIMPLNTGQKLITATNTLNKFIQSINSLNTDLEGIVATLGDTQKSLKSYGIGFLEEFIHFNYMDSNNICNLLSIIYDDEFILDINKQVNANMQKNNIFRLCCGVNDDYSRVSNSELRFIYSEKHKEILYRNFYDSFNKCVFSKSENASGVLEFTGANADLNLSLK